MASQHGNPDKFSAYAYADILPAPLTFSNPEKSAEASLLEFVGKYPLSHRKLNIETLLIFILHSNGMTGSELTKLFNCSASKISKSISHINDVLQTLDPHLGIEESENFLFMTSCILKKYAISLQQRKYSNSSK